VNSNPWSDLIDLLGRRNVIFKRGLSDPEILQAESSYDFVFPPDLREFLQTALPTGYASPDWRSGDEATTREMLHCPLEGLLFDVEQNDLWLEEWGARPSATEDALSIARDQVSRAPGLIPVNAHRMIPDRPHCAGNPILSVYQTDIIGFDLDDNFRHEFDPPSRKEWAPEIRPIDFWNVEGWQDLRWR
jgi:hypothetical protein